MENIFKVVAIKNDKPLNLAKKQAKAAPAMQLLASLSEAESFAANTHVPGMHVAIWDGISIYM